MPLGAEKQDVLVQADQGVPPGLIHDLEPIVSKLREYSGNPTVCLVIRRVAGPEYEITLSGSRSETKFTVPATPKVVEDVHCRLLGSACEQSME